MERITKVARIILDGKPYLVYRDFGVEGMLRDKGLERCLRRLLITDESGSNTFGCIVFYSTVLSAYSWKTDEKTLYGFGEMLEFSFANLLPHLPLLTIGKLRETFSRGSMCLAVSFEDEPDGFKKDGITYNIQLKDSFFKTSQRFFFPDGLIKKQIRHELLQILLNSLEENPNTFMKIEELEASIPLTTKDLWFNLGILNEEELIEFITSPEDPKTIISVKIKAKGIKELEAQVDVTQQYPPVVKHIYGINIENTTHGPNSPITVSVDQIGLIFNAIQNEVQEDTTLKNKDEVIKIIKELKIQATETKDPKKTATLLEKLKGSAGWVYEKIISNPIITSIITDLLLKATHL